jgi:hypothetical protein
MRKLVLSLLLLFCVQAFSQTTVADPAYANMQRAIGGIVQQSAQARGFSPTDPRTYSTLYSMGKMAATGVAIAGAGILVGGTAPAWGSVLAVAAVSASVGYAVNLGLDKLLSWSFGNSPSSVTVTDKTQSSSICPDNSYCAALASLQRPSGVVWVQTPSGWMQSSGCSNMPPDQGSVHYFASQDGSILYATIGYYRDGSLFVDVNQSTLGCTSALGPLSSIQGGTVAPVQMPLPAAISSVPAQTMSSPVDYSTMALMVNQLWQQAAAQSDYAGLPYQMTQPVTSADVQAWAQANPQAYPTVSALMAPVANPATGFAPSTSTSSNTSVTAATSQVATGSINPASSQQQVNLGADPSIGSPTLEVPPTGAEILGPLTSLFPDLKNYAVPAHAAECPKPVFNLFGKSTVMDSHCTLFEQNRALIYTIMVVVFSISVLFIILSA